MPFDLSKLDEKIAAAEAETRRLQEARRLLSDPAMSQLLVDCLTNGDGMTRNGAGHHQNTTGTATTNPAMRPPVATRFVGGLKDTVTKTVALFGPGLEFSLEEVYDLMVSGGFNFKTKRPRVAVGIELRKMHAENKIKLVERGSGSIPSKFRIPEGA